MPESFPPVPECYAAYALEAKPGKAAVLEQQVLDLGSCVTKVTKAEANVWSVLMGRGPGSFILTLPFTSMTSYGDFQHSLRANAEYNLRMEALEPLLSAPIRGEHHKRIFSVGSMQRVKVIQVTTTDMVAPIEKTLEWSQAGIEKNQNVTNAAGMLTVSLSGAYNGIATTFGYESLEQLDLALLEREAYPGRLAYYDESAGMFVPGSGQRFIAELKSNRGSAD